MNEVIINYCMGNLHSVQKRLQRIEAEVEISSVAAIISKAEKLILPGVGHFANGIKKLKDRGYFDSEIAVRQYKNHILNRTDISKEIWQWLNLELWFKKYIDNQ